MIIHASLKTDIAQYYTDWFFNRINEGFVDIRDRKGINRYNFKTNKLTKIFFWSKDPQPLIKRFNDLKTMPYDFEVITELTFYDKCYEPKIKAKNRIMETVRKASTILGKDKVSICYGPIFSTYNCPLQWHKDQFRFLCEQLHQSINKVYVGYEISSGCLNMQNYNIRRLTFDEQDELDEYFEEIVSQYGLELCYKPDIADLKEYEIDIGAMNACPATCVYCPGISNRRQVKPNHNQHHTYSSLLIGKVEYDAKIKDIKLPKEGENTKNTVNSLFNF